MFIANPSGLLQGGNFWLSRAAWIVCYRWGAAKSINFIQKSTFI